MDQLYHTSIAGVPVLERVGIQLATAQSSVCPQIVSQRTIQALSIARPFCSNDCGSVLKN